MRARDGFKAVAEEGAVGGGARMTRKGDIKAIIGDGDSGESFA
jgi:hypothetical protein